MKPNWKEANVEDLKKIGKRGKENIYEWKPLIEEIVASGVPIVEVIENSLRPEDARSRLSVSLGYMKLPYRAVVINKRIFVIKKEVELPKSQSVELASAPESKS
jgi:hypothetical protein